MVQGLVMQTTNNKTQDLVAVIGDALGGNWSGKYWSKEGVERAYLYDGKKPAGYITVNSLGAVDVSNAKLSSSMHGKAEGWIAAELAKLTA
jgi:hypothetical protein